MVKSQGYPLQMGKFLVSPTGLGIRVEEERGPDQTIARLDCARTAFVGRTLRGPVSRPVTVSSFAEFQHAFGGLWQPSPLGYAVEHFFDNGGREALVVRVVNGASPVTLSLSAGLQSFRLRAVRPGTREFLRASVDYDNIAAADTSEFNLLVQRVRVQGTAQVEDQEIFARLSLSPDSERFVGDVLAYSELVEIDGAIPSERPAQTVDSSSGLATGYVSSNSDGDDGAPLTDYDLIGSEAEHTGLYALDSAEYFNFLCIPPLSREHDVGPSVLLVAARYCKAKRALLIIDPPSDWHTADEALRGMRHWNCSSENALMYFPRILAYDKLRGHFELFASSGAAAGILARLDQSHPVWGPMKVDEAVLRPGYRPSCLVTEDKRMRLASLGVNIIQAVRSAARIGVHSRTLAAGTAGAADWQRLSERRLALFILNSIERGTRWARFSPSPTELAEMATAQLNDFFGRLHASGAFGSRPLEDSFFVICDGRINVPDSAVPNSFQFLVGFAAIRAGEFHCFKIRHTATGSTVAPASLNRLRRSRCSPAELEWVDTLASQIEQ